MMSGRLLDGFLRCLVQILCIINHNHVAGKDVEAEVTRRTHDVHDVHVGDVVMRAAGCRYSRAIFPFSYSLLFFSWRRFNAVHLSWNSCSADPKHHDLHLTSVATYFLCEGVGVLGSLANINFRYFYPLTCITPASFSGPLLHSSRTSSLGTSCSRGQYLGHARLVTALIRCHLRPKYCKEDQISRHPHPIIGPGIHTWKAEPKAPSYGHGEPQRSHLRMLALTLWVFY